MLKGGGYLTVRVGRGTASSTTFFWGSSTPVFGNISSPQVEGDLGDGAYLFDPQGGIRSQITYPCVLSCADPAAGKIALAPVIYDPAGDDASNPHGEIITIAAVGSPVDLTRKVLVLGGHVVELPIGTVLQPGERLQVRSGRGTSSRLVRYWQSDGPLLGNAGGSVRLRNSEGTLLTCRAWGSASC